MFEALFRLWPQWFAALIVTLLCVDIGFGVGWISPYLALLADQEQSFSMIEEQATWIIFLLPLGRLFGAIVGSLFVEYRGSKMALLLTGMPLMIGWICIICGNSTAWVYSSRLFIGASMGMLFSCYPLYIGEISAPSIRGALASVIINGILLGVLLGNVMGPCMSMTCFGIVGLTLTLCYIGAFSFLPHSPHYLVQRNDMKRAEKAVQWYHRKSDMRDELEAVERFVESSRTNARERLRRMRESKNWRAFAIIILLFTFMQLSGLNTIAFYTEIIVKRAMVTSITPSCVAIIVNTTGIIFGWIAACAIDRCGRRILLAISSAGVMIGALSLGVHFLLLDYDCDPGELEWLAILSLQLFMLLCLGLVPVPITMLSELFPCELKSTAGFVGSVTSATFAFATSWSYQPLVDLMGEQYHFWINAVIIAVCLIYSLVWMPETKEKTLQEIQDMPARRNATVTQRENHTEAEETL